MVLLPSEYSTYVLVHKYCPLATLGTDSFHSPVGVVVPLSLAWYVTLVDDTVTDVPLLATANENFLFISIPSTWTGIVASQEVDRVDVILNVIVTFGVPLPSTEAEMPGGHIISPTVTSVIWLEPQNATTSVIHFPEVAPDVPPTNV